MLKLLLFLASIANVAAGVGLAGLYFRFRPSGGVPVVVLLVALSLFTQGAFTIAYVRGALRRWGSAATQLFVAGECAAGLVGALETVHGVVYNLNPRNGDYEFGPLTAALLLGAHAAVGLLYARDGQFTDPFPNHRAGSGA